MTDYYNFTGFNCNLLNEYNNNNKTTTTTTTSLFQVKYSLQSLCPQFSEGYSRRQYKRKKKIRTEEMKPWIIERLDRKLTDAIVSNIVEKCGVTSSRAIQHLTSDVLRVLLFIAYFISLSSTIQIAHVLK